MTDAEKTRIEIDAQKRLGRALASALIDHAASTGDAFEAATGQAYGTIVVLEAATERMFAELTGNHGHSPDDIQRLVAAAAG